MSSLAKALQDMEDAKNIIEQNGLDLGIRLGQQKGLEAGLEAGQHIGIRNMIQLCQDFGVTRANTSTYILKYFLIPQIEVEKYLNTYWKI